METKSSPDEEIVDINELNINEATLTTIVKKWIKQIKTASEIVQQIPPPSEPYKTIYEGIQSVKTLLPVVQKYATSEPILKSKTFYLWTNFSLIHVYSCLAKWSELCEEMSDADAYHLECIELIESVTEHLSKSSVEKEETSEIESGKERCNYMLIYEWTRYAILCSQRDNQEKALEYLKKAEVFYHSNKNHKGTENTNGVTKSLLQSINSLNSETSKDMFTYVLFYLGQAYKIKGEKEKAALYLHMVLRRQLAETEDFNPITWASDTAKMASVLIVNMQAFETARNILLGATVVLNQVSEEKKNSDDFKQAYADLGRVWIRLGVDLLEASGERLKDLEEQTKKCSRSEKIFLEDHEKRSLEINDTQHEFNTMHLISNIGFPSLNVALIAKNEMKGKFVRDYDEARGVFLAVQKWVNVAKDYYVIDEFATDYIEIMTDYSNAFKYLSIFEPYLERQIKMQRRRITILEGLLESLNPKIFSDIFHYLLRDIAEINEKIYNLKVTEIRESGRAMMLKDNKVVKWLENSIKANKKNLENFGFDLTDPKKDFPEEYERTLLGCVLSTGRVLGNISHEHPLYWDVITLAEEGKQFYEFFLKYLDHRPTLKTEFKVLYDASQEIPELLDRQIRKIKAVMRSFQNNSGS